MHRFFSPNIATDLFLSPEESLHCAKVLRMGIGDMIEVVDGQGNLYYCRLTSAHQKRCQVQILEHTPQPNPWPCRIELAMAPTKNMDRIEWVAEKCTEIGIDRFIPILCQHSERRVLKTERLEKILVSAMKQSLKAVLPELTQLTPVTNLLREPFDGQKFIAYCDPALPRAERLLLTQQITTQKPVRILIGPEGDFSNQEVNLALEQGYLPVTLGESRLRAETAAVHACSCVHALHSIVL